MTLYIYRVGWTYPARNPITRSKSIKIPSCTRFPLGPVRPVDPTGQTGRLLPDRLQRLTGRVDRSDRSKWNPSTTRDFNRFRSCNWISCGISPPHPINIKGHGRLGIQSIKSIQLLSFYFSLALAFPIYYLLFLRRLYVD